MAKAVNARSLCVCSLLLLAISEAALAQVTLAIRGVIMAPPSCVINGGSTLNVPFGNALMTTRIDGLNYRRKVPYTVTCTGLPSNGMTLKLQGTGAGFDSAFLSTSNADLGIKLFINGVVWPLNNTVSFTYPTLPSMEAVPVKKSGSVLNAGTFSASASATVVVAWQ